MKVAHDNDDAARAAEAMRQIIETAYARGLANPVLLGIAVNDQDSIIKYWECRGGIAEKPMAPTGTADEGETPMAPTGAADEGETPMAQRSRRPR